MTDEIREGLEKYLKELHETISSPVLEVIINEVLKFPEVKELFEIKKRLEKYLEHVKSFNGYGVVPGDALEKIIIEILTGVKN